MDEGVGSIDTLALLVPFFLHPPPPAPTAPLYALLGPLPFLAYQRNLGAHTTSKSNTCTVNKSLSTANNASSSKPLCGDSDDDLCQDYVDDYFSRDPQHLSTPLVLIQ